MELNSKILKVSGKIELDPEKLLENGQILNLTVQGQIVQVADGDNQDGTFDRTYKLKLMTGEIK